MKIEIALAIVLGVILGIVGMFTVVGMSKKEATFASPAPTTLASATPSEKATGSEPKDNTSWDSSPINIKGSATNMPFLIVSGPTQDTLVLLKDNHYETTVNAIQGLGRYVLFSPKGNVVSSSTLMSYDSLVKSQDIFLGAVTDITQDGLQMRTEDGTIEQISFDRDLILASFVKDTKKIAIGDVAIGDKVVIAGKRDRQMPIIAKGVFVLNSGFVLPSYSLNSGELLKIGKSEFTIKLEGSEKTYKTDKSTKFFGLKSDFTTRNRTKIIADDVSSVLYVTEVATNSASTARSIFISE